MKRTIVKEKPYRHRSIFSVPATGPNVSEKRFASYAKRHRYKWIRYGWPDFFVQDPKTRKFLGVEVKKGTYPLLPTQRACFAALEAAGVEVVVWNPACPDVLMPWRNYKPYKPKRPRKKRKPYRWTVRWLK